MDRIGAQKIAIVAAVNNEEILAKNLAQSYLVRSGSATLNCYRNFASAGVAYNRGIDDTTSEYIIFAHQDVYLPAEWHESLQTAVAKLGSLDPNWAVLGAFGIAVDGSRIGHVWSSGLSRLLGAPLCGPMEATCVDELLLVVNRNCGIRFDEKLPGFHLYGADIVLEARRSGLRCYVAELPVIHNSRPVRTLGAEYAKAYRYMQRKWAALLPVDTLIAPITKSPWTLRKARLLLQYRRLKRRVRGMSPVSHNTNPVELATKVGFERRMEHLGKMQRDG